MRSGPGCGTWGRAAASLRPEATAAVNQIRDLLECAWPAVLAASGKPVPVGDLVRVAGRGAGPVRRGPAPGPAAGPGAVHRGWAAQARVGRDPAVPADHPGRVRRIVGPGRGHRAPPRRPGTRAPGAGRLAGYPRPARRDRDPDGRGPGGPRACGPRYHDRRADRDRGCGDLAKTATRRGSPPRGPWSSMPGCARDNASGAAQGKTSISGRGRPGLRVAAWRAVWAAMPNNPVMAARFSYLTTRQDNRLARQQARTACAAALLRWIHVVVTRQVAWDPAIAAGCAPAQQAA